MLTTRPRMRILAMAGLFLTLSTRAQAQPAPAPELDPQTIEVAKNALELARKAWGSAQTIEGGLTTSGSTATAGQVLLTSEAAAAGVALVQAAGLIGASVGYGNPYSPTPIPGAGNR